MSSWAKKKNKLGGGGGGGEKKNTLVGVQFATLVLNLQFIKLLWLVTPTVRGVARWVSGKMFVVNMSFPESLSSFGLLVLEFQPTQIHIQTYHQSPSIL